MSACVWRTGGDVGISFLRWPDGDSDVDPDSLITACFRWSLYSASASCARSRTPGLSPPTRLVPTRAPAFL